MAEQNVWFCTYQNITNPNDVSAASNRTLALKLGVEAVKLHWEHVTDPDVRQSLRVALAAGDHDRVIQVWNAYTDVHYIDIYGPTALVNEDFNNGNFPEEPAS